MRALAAYVHQCRNKIDLDNFTLKYAKSRWQQREKCACLPHMRVRPTALHPPLPLLRALCPLSLKLANVESSKTEVNSLMYFNCPAYVLSSVPHSFSKILRLRGVAYSQALKTNTSCSFKHYYIFDTHFQVFGCVNGPPRGLFPFSLSIVASLSCLCELMMTLVEDPWSRFFPNYVWNMEIYALQS